MTVSLALGLMGCLYCDSVSDIGSLFFSDWQSCCGSDAGIDILVVTLLCMAGGGYCTISMTHCYLCHCQFMEDDSVGFNRDFILKGKFRPQSNIGSLVGYL